jgi:hypothetical protein
METTIKNRFVGFSHDERVIIQNALIAQVRVDRRTSDHWGAMIVERLMDEISSARKAR